MKKQTIALLSFSLAGALSVGGIIASLSTSEIQGGTGNYTLNVTSLTASTENGNPVDFAVTTYTQTKNVKVAEKEVSSLTLNTYPDGTVVRYDGLRNKTAIKGMKSISFDFDYEIGDISSTPESDYQIYLYYGNSSYDGALTSYSASLQDITEKRFSVNVSGSPSYFVILPWNTKTTTKTNVTWTISNLSIAYSC